MTAVDPCPHCGFELDDGDIYERYFEMYGNKAKARKAASCHGATPKNPLRFSKKIGIYDMNKDRTIRYECPECSKEVGR